MDTIVYTIGHSNQTMEAFLEILDAYNIRMLVDVRRFPISRRYPWFNHDELSASLHDHQIGYIHLEALGGRRQPEKESVNMGWRNAAFRGYADYMQTTAFRENLNKLVEITRREHTVIMCAEVLPWRCHRSLLADALLVKGLQVENIYSAKVSKPHLLHSWAVIQGEQITYPPEESPADEGVA